MRRQAPATQHLRVDHEAGDRFRISIRRHVLDIDQLESDGGQDAGPTPVELYVAGLVSCVAHYAHSYLARHGLSGGLAATAEFSMAFHPTRVGEVTIELQTPGELPPERRAALLAFASRCSVHNTLRHPPEVRIRLSQMAQASP